MTRHRWLWPWATGLCALLLAGCGERQTIVEGTVSIKGTKLNNGRLTFHGASNKYTTGITSEGTYKAISPPTGEVKVTVESENIAGGKAKTPPPPKGAPLAVDPNAAGGGGGGVVNQIPIPPMYKELSNAETVTVQEGTTQKIDINFGK